MNKVFTAVVLSAGVLVSTGASAAPSGWTTMKTSKLAGDEYLNQVAATGKKNAWAMGHYDPGTGFGILAYRWNGETWKRSTLPVSVASCSFQNEPALDAKPGAGAWALVPCERNLTTILRWKNGKWRIAAKLPALMANLEVVGKRDVWAFGGEAGYPSSRLAMHFDGARWRKVKLPTQVNQAAAVSSEDIWAIGGGESEKVLHYDGKRWRIRQGVLPANVKGKSHTFVSGISVHRGRILIAGAVHPTDYFLDSHRKGFLLRQTRGGWTRENPPALRTWAPAAPVVDDRGGLWMRLANIGFDDEKEALAYRSPSGVWKRFSPIWDDETDGGARDYISALTAVPGTSRLFGVGSTDGAKDTDAFMARRSSTP